MAIILVAPVLTPSEASLIYVHPDHLGRAANAPLSEQGRHIAPSSTRAIAPLENQWMPRSRAAFIVGAALACWAPPVLLALLIM
ncbi:hypothetical protein HL653_23105 [Sphingomonas sp. AP4-R1]|uniref:hypothetical protein n=1 Tax=Sphingomonas sp. AP4-R1 TaxID=2735134 RepID=UPI001493AD9D|nr:hypothetical protein [Sphingomonas sp. AP4-R1]QJU60241.1 hypothetical protein HL653_23105 [Sphingomonas sp. AP4-R1]